MIRPTIDLFNILIVIIFSILIFKENYKNLIKKLSSSLFFIVQFIHHGGFTITIDMVSLLSQACHPGWLYTLEIMSLTGQVVVFYGKILLLMC